MDQRQKQFEETRREIIKDLVTELGEDAVRLRARDFQYVTHINDMAWKMVNSGSVRELNPESFKRHKKIKHPKKVTA